MLTGADAGMKWFTDPSDPREAPESWAHVCAAQLLEVRRRAVEEGGGGCGGGGKGGGGNGRQACFPGGAAVISWLGVDVLAAIKATINFFSRHRKTTGVPRS